MVGSGRRGGGGVGTAVCVGWKLLITHDTWWRGEKSFVPLQQGDRGYKKYSINGTNGMRGS